MRHHEQCAIQPQPLDEISNRLADQRLEHAVKMERRKHRGIGHVVEPEAQTQVPDDVVNREVDPLNVGQRCRVARLFGSPQDLSRPPLGRAHDAKPAARR